MQRNRIPLFYSDPTAPPESKTFIIDYDRQLTVTAIGLQAGDSVGFQMVYVPALDPDSCTCPPFPVVLPSVAAVQELRCCGTPITLTEDNPVVILDNPQRTLLRAVLNTSDPDGIYVWAVETATHDLNDRLRGCSCGTTGE